MATIRTMIVAAAFLTLDLALIASATTVSGTVEELAWLAGCWASVGGEPGSGEQWMAPAGGSLFGVNWTIRDSKTVAFEFMQIRQTGEGVIEFQANPSGQDPAVFTMTGMTEVEVVFENPDHDFPTKITYNLVDENRLEARIAGVRNGEAKVIAFAFARVECGAEAE